jgi:tripartite-type tricarboxylate transporter receptor subunit TctC
MAGVDMVHVPYQGASPMLVDLLAGRIQVTISIANQLLPHIQQGNLRALADGGAQRNPTLPDLPSIGESLPGYSVDIWSGIVMPAGTPREIVEKTARDITTVVSMPEVQEEFAKQGVVTTTATPQQMEEIMHADLDRWGKLVTESGLRAR